MDLDNFNLDISSFNIIQTDKKDNENNIDNDEKQPDAICVKLESKHLYRRLISERQLEMLVEWEFQKGASYHFLSQGDIDSFSFLKLIMRQQRIDYLIASTWCMATADVNEFEYYYKIDRIKKMDFYVGEIFPNTYSNVYFKLKELIKKCEGRIAVFRNHSKIFIGFGEKFNFVIESSANINTNPRTENTCITLDDKLAIYYKEYFDNIIAFNKDFNHWKPTDI